MFGMGTKVVGLFAVLIMLVLMGCGDDSPGSAVGDPCEEPSDCASETCSNNMCSPAGGTDGGTDSDTDPGDGGTDSNTDGGIDSGPDAADVGIDTRPDPTPACNDGMRNNDEDGVDCGGACIRSCYTEVTAGFGENLVLYGGTLFHLYGTFGDGGSSDLRVRVRRSSNRGETWADTVVTTQASAGLGSLLVSGDTTTPTVRVVLSYSVGDESEGVFTATSTDGGATFGEPVHISDATDLVDDDSAASGGVSFPGVAATTSGTTIAAAWTDYSPNVHPRGEGVWDVFFNHSSDGGASWNEARSIHAGTRQWISPLAIASEGQNVWVLVPLDPTGGHNLSVIRSADGGMTFGDPVIAVPKPSPDGNIRTPYVVQDNGSLHVVYSRNQVGSANMEIGYSRSDDDGVSWTPHVRVSDEGAQFRPARISNYVGAPRVHALSDGRLVAVWVDERLSDDATTVWAPQYSVSTDDGLTWSADTLIRGGSGERQSNTQSVVFEDGGSAELLVIHSDVPVVADRVGVLVSARASLD